MQQDSWPESNQMTGMDQEAIYTATQAGAQVLTGFAKEVDGVPQLRLLQLQLALLNELEHVAVPKNGEFRGNRGPPLQKLPLQLHIAVWNQLPHHRLTLDLGGRDAVGSGQQGGGRRSSPCSP